jgi:AraC-like DNA-binding protein
VDLALGCGYFDQSHLVRDVRRFTGLTPTELVGQVSGRTALSA